MTYNIPKGFVMPEEKNNIFKKAREERGLTRSQVAHSVDVTYHAVATWEYGKGYPRPSNLKAVKEVLGLTPNEIFDIRE